jgi:hypothetical protein
VTMISNADLVAVNLARLPATQLPRVAQALNLTALRLQTMIQANASGRPGPRVQTGDYRRSWNTRTGIGPDGPWASVGTNAPQARRLEFGFSGTDSIGRNYNQPPYPHVATAVAQIQPILRTNLAAALTT